MMRNSMSAEIKTTLNCTNNENGEHVELKVFTVWMSENYHFNSFNSLTVNHPTMWWIHEYLSLHRNISMLCLERHQLSRMSLDCTTNSYTAKQRGGNSFISNRSKSSEIETVAYQYGLQGTFQHIECSFIKKKK